MNLTQLKTYAPAARNAFIKAVTRRAGLLGIQPDRVEPVMESGDVALIAGQPFPRSIILLRKKLLEIIQRDGFAPTMEAMAYTWFNRLVALRFMELHDGYLDHGYRVLSHPEGNSLPEILQHAEHVELKGLDRDEVIRLKLNGNRDEELYRLLLLAQCNQLNHIMPSVFSKLDDVTILLLPDNLLHSDSVIRQLVNGSEPADWEQVEVLGWLYQFYISEKKDAVMARKSAVPTADIPAVTQLFTPHWIVRYLVENSLGRLWLLNRPSSRLRKHMPYYIEGEAETDFLKIAKPEDIKLVDPACGSGHILAYAFDLLYLIYEEEGYAAEDIPGLILKHNLFGLEICPRAAQLAELTLVLKAREKSRKFFSAAKAVRPRIIELSDVRYAENELSDYIRALKLGNIFQQTILKLLHQFEEAKNFGSLIQPCETEAAILEIRGIVSDRWSEITNQSPSLFLRETHLKVLRVLEQAEALTQRYHVVVANPPYMGFKQMNSSLRSFGESEFNGRAMDLFGMFIQRCKQLGINNGIFAMITMDSWMYGDDHTDLRQWVYENASCSSMLHLGPRAFDEIGGEVVQVTAFVFFNRSDQTRRADYFRLVSLKPSAAKERAFLAGQYHYRAAFASFADVPRKILAYQATERTLDTFRSGHPLREIAEAFTGLQTGDNPRFIHYWFEVSSLEVAFDCKNRDAANATRRRWFPYVKGSDFRKWFGNNICVLDWLEDGREIRNHQSSTIRNSQYYFQEGLAYNNIANSFSVRHVDAGFICDQKNSMFFGSSPEGLQLALGFLNSPLVAPYLEILSPKDFNPGSLKVVPTLFEKCDKRTVENVVQELIALARADWDNFETSWDFRDFPLLRSGKLEVESGKQEAKTAGTFHSPLPTSHSLKGPTLAESWANWKAYCSTAIRRMQELETENNRLFIAAYGLEGELQPEVSEEQITLARADAKKDMAAFLSYAVGCMMGRYSLDAEGLILANGGNTVEDYVRIVAVKKVESEKWKVESEKQEAKTGESGKLEVESEKQEAKTGESGKQEAKIEDTSHSPLPTSHFPLPTEFHPDSDGIIPVLDGEWFEDDIVARTKEFLRATFGEATLGENLRFIEQSLGRELRDYFLTDFYKDHLQTYKNRPIYWLFSSGKQKAFQCLVYLHRYTPGTLARIRTEYAIPLQGKLAARITRLEEEVTQTSSSATRKKLQTDLDKSKKQMVELLAYDEQLRSYTNHPIALDLDDGVKTNYAKFGPLVAESKKVCGTKDD